jgi:hypothetical protein
MTGTEAKAVALLEQMALALTRIAAGIDRATTIEAGPPLSCLHPPEFRMDFSGMQGSDEWECATKLGGCGFRYPHDLAAESTADEPTIGRE